MVTIIASTLMFYACTNPGGTLGPSWDITAKIPLIKGTEKNTIRIEDLIGDDINLQEGYTESLLDSGNSLYALGNELSEISFSGFSTSIELGSIEIGGLIGTREFDVITANIEGGIEEDIGDITFDADFDSLSLSEDSQEALITINSTTGSISDHISGLRIKVFNNGVNKGTLYFDTLITGDDLNTGVEEKWDMKNLSLTGNQISLKLMVEEITLDEEIIVSVQFPSKLKVAELSNLKLTDFSDIDTRLESEITIDDLNLNNGVKKIGFVTGNISIDISSVSNNFTGLSVENLNIAGLSAETDLISLAGQELSFLDGEKLQTGMTLRANDELISFSSDSEVKISGTFENIGISYLEVNIDEAKETLDFDGDVVIDELEIELDDELRDELHKLNIKPEIILNIVSLEGMKLEPFELVFNTFDDSGNPVGEEISFEIEVSESGNSIIDIKPLFDRIKEPEVNRISGSCNYGLSGEEVIVTPESKVGIESIELRVPYEFSLNDDMEFTLDPEKVEALDSGTREMLENDAKGMLVIGNLDNNLPLAVAIEVYAVVISEPHLTNEELKETLYKPENLLKSKALAQREYYEKYLLEIKAEDLDIFTEDNVYTGVKIVLPANNGEDKYQFLAGDKLTFDSIYLSLTGHLNR